MDKNMFVERGGGGGGGKHNGIQSALCKKGFRYYLQLLISVSRPYIIHPVELKEVSNRVIIPRNRYLLVPGMFK